MIGTRGHALTAYFAGLVVLAAAAAAAAIGYVFVQTDRDSRAAAERDARFAAAAAAKELGDGLSGAQATVANLARTPNIEQAASQPTCTLGFSATSYYVRGHVDVIRPDGSVACSSRPRPAGGTLRGYRGAAWLGSSGAKPRLLAPVADPATGDRSAVAFAATPRHWVVATFVALEPLGRRLAAAYAGGRPAELMVTSADGATVLSRSVRPEAAVGRSLAGTDFARRTGHAARRDLDGRPRLYEQATVSGAGWQLYVGEDEAAALAAGHRLRTRQLVIILTGLGIVLLAMLVVYRRVAAPVRRLGAAVQAATGSLPPAPVDVSGPAEIAALGRHVNELIEAVGRELGRRREAEHTVVESERSYRALFDQSPLPKWIYDAETGDVVAANDAAVACYGYSRDEFLQLSARDLVSAPAAAAGAPLVPSSTLLEPATHRGKEAAIRVRTISHDVTFEGRAARCVVAEDVRERERLERQLRQAQKMEAVGHLAGGIAHDFNNLLTVISGYGAMARERIGAGPGGRELTEIDRAAERATQLTQQLLAFSRQQVVDPVVLDLNEVVAAVTPMLARLIGDDVELGVIGAEEAPRVLADRGQVEQVIVNLAVNARDAMPGGGTLTIETGRVTLDARYTAVHPGAEPGVYACLAVSDSGVGIDRETQTHIFEPFFTTKEAGRGTGLGLSTVHGVVKQAGGHVEVYSEPGLGTTFKIYLPAAADAAALAAGEAPETPESLGGTETILLCEDDDLVRDLVDAILTANGYTVLCASRPEEALELAAAHDGSMGALVSDIVMPHLSGPDLFTRLERDRPGLRAVLLSGYTAETIRSRGLPPGSVFVQKPFSDVALLRALRGLLDGAPGEEGQGAGTRAGSRGAA